MPQRQFGRRHLGPGSRQLTLQTEYLGFGSQVVRTQPARAGQVSLQLADIGPPAFNHGIPTIGRQGQQWLPGFYLISQLHVQLLHRSGYPGTHHHRLPGLKLALEFQHRLVAGGCKGLHLDPDELPLLLHGLRRGLVTGDLELTGSHPDNQKHNYQQG